MGTSWKWQLRDRLGQWMDMDSEVRWMARGKMHQGHVVGSPEDGLATIKEAGGRKVNIPTDRLTAITLPAGDVAPQITKKAAAAPAAPKIPKDFASLSDQQITDLYWAARDHPDVPLTKWLRVAWEMQKRRVNVDPHTYPPAGVFAAGAPAPSSAANLRLMQIRIIERELSLV